MVNVDGSGQRRLGALVGGSVVDWLPGGERLVFTGRAAANVDGGVWYLDLRDGRLIELHRQARMSGFQVSPDGEWLAYTATFQASPADNGLNLMRLEPRERRVVGWPGSYRWAPAGGRMVVIPPRAGPDVPFVVRELDPATGDAVDLTDPARVDLRIANYDWALSPDGRRIAYVSSADYAIWVLQLRP
jgi:Tol biopolymer transport system component